MSSGISLGPLHAFLLLLTRPRSGIQALQARGVRPGHLALFLVIVGLVRGVLDLPWLFWQAGQLPLLGPSVTLPAWYLISSGPFILSEIVTALVRWVLFAWLIHVLCSYLGGQGRYTTTLQTVGVLLGITIATIAINYLHLVVPLPLIRFQAAPRYNPIIGVGQVLTSIWIGFIIFQLVRAEYGLDRWSAIMVAACIPLLNTALFLVVARVLFWGAPATLARRTLLITLNVGFIVVGIVAFGLLLWWGRRHFAQREEQARPQPLTHDTQPLDASL